MTSPIHLKKFNQFLEKFTEKLHFWGKIIRICIISKLEDVEKFQIRCHHLYAKGYHAYRFGDSSINSVGGDAGKQTDGQTDRQTDGRTANSNT